MEMGLDMDRHTPNSTVVTVVYGAVPLAYKAKGLSGRPLFKSRLTPPPHPQVESEGRVWYSTLPYRAARKQKGMNAIISGLDSTRITINVASVE